MIKWIGIALATIATIGVAAHVVPVMAASAVTQKAQLTQTIDARMRGHSRDRYRTIDQPSYYVRPTVYAPAPFVPLPPFFGYGWEWW